MYDPPSLLTLHQTILDGYRNQIDNARVDEESELYARAYGFAGAAALVSRGLRYVEDQVFVASADSTNLDRWANEYGMDGRKAPTAASGIIVVTGDTGATVDAGTTVVADNGVEFETVDTLTIVEGVNTVEVVALTGGTDGNLSAGDTLTFQSPPTSIDSEASVFIGGLTGGTDLESDAALRARILLRRRAGSAGGTKTDYQQWALTIEGITEAHVLPLRRGLGSVDIAVFTLDGDDHRTPADEGLVDAVQAYLETVRPVTADVLVIAATEVTKSVTCQILLIKDGYDEAEVLAAVEAALTAYFYDELGTGDTLYRSALRTVIGNVAGVGDFALISPDDDDAPTLDADTAEIFAPGTMTAHGPDWVSGP